MILAHAGVARNIRNVVAQAQHSKHDHSHNRVGDSMQKFNDGKSEEQVLDEVLRDYLLSAMRPYLSNISRLKIWLLSKGLTIYLK